MTPQIIGYYFIRDDGDGSASVVFFNDKESCDAAMAAEEEEYGFVLSGTETLYNTDFQ